MCLILASCKFAVFTPYVLFRIKDKKVGEGTYAVVYQGKCFLAYLPYIAYEGCFYVGREASTGRKVAIKKIKVGQFKDGLDMSAIREVKYLRELKHQNIIEVRVSLGASMHSL